MNHTPFKCTAVLLWLLTSSCFLDPEVRDVRVAAPGDGDTPAVAVDAGIRGDAASASAVSFARDIRPLLAGIGGMTGCRPCHYATDPNPIGITVGGLDLTTLGALRRGGASSGDRIIVPGKPDESILVQRIEGTIGTRMPKGRDPLSTADILKVRVWIAQGARGEDAE